MMITLIVLLFNFLALVVFEVYCCFVSNVWRFDSCNTFVCFVCFVGCMVVVGCFVCLLLLVWVFSLLFAL